MKFKFNSLIAILSLFLAISHTGKAQEVLKFNTAGLQYNPINPLIYYNFDQDSLKGFDEDAARKSLLSANYFGSEFKNKLYSLKRGFINDKYNLWQPITPYVSRPSVSPGCVNEDFEASTAGIITTSNQIAGWTVTHGNHTLTSGSNACNLTGCCPQAPTEAELIDIPSGGIDNNIGSQYPIFSVFGSTPGTPLGISTNSHIPQGVSGTKIIRINSAVNNESIEKLTKSFLVTPNNALLQYAFLLVVNGAHPCCSAGAFQVHVVNGSCPQFTAFATGASCTIQPVGFTYSPGLSSSGTPNGWQYNNWCINSMDLTSYIGQTVTVEFAIADCDAGGHASYFYFDAQCGPISVIGNNTPYPATTATTNVTIPTCGAAGATICAAAGLGPYYWQGVNVPPSYATPAYTNQCFVTNLSATYTLYMNPPGSCAPITRVVNSTITAAPALNINVAQAQCGTTTATVTVIPGGSATNPANINWVPAPSGLNTTTTVATYSIPTTPSSSNVITVTAADPLGCLITVTAAVNAAPPVPTFSIINVGPTASITCINPTVNLATASTYSYNNGSLSYTWASNNATFNTSTADITLPGTFVVTGQDPATNCSIVHTISVGANLITPTANVAPLFQNITCTIPAVPIQATANPGVNVSHYFLAPQGGSFVTQASTVSYIPGGPGTYTYILVNDVNGCKTVKTISVTASQGFPTFSVSSTPLNYTLGCSTTSVTTVNILGANTDPAGGAVTYTILSPGSTATPSGILSTISNYSVNTPGSYTVIVIDNFTQCKTQLPITIINNNQGPTIDSLLYPTNILDCNTPSVIVRGISFNTNTSFNWKFPQAPGNIYNDSITVVTNTIAATNSLIATYTLAVTDNINKCISTRTLPMYQNLYAPLAIITASPRTISCKVPTITLTNGSSSKVPTGSIFPTGKIVSASWVPPSPQTAQQNVSSMVALAPGDYTMTATDYNNGCSNVTVMTIGDGRNYPDVTVASTYSIDCGISTSLTPVYPTTGGSVSVLWTTPTNAPSGPTTAKILTGVSVPGEYGLTVTDEVSGCVILRETQVVSNTSINANFVPDKLTGYAPLTINFENTSASADPTDRKMNSVWDFGNSTIQNYSTATALGSATYLQPGTYTITLTVAKGSCLNSVQKTVTVDIPSKLTIPNVFSPNNDKVNDIFFLKVVNLSSIDAKIFDRWGHKVYELITDKENANIAWDGKDQTGTDVAAGTYFYVIKATGKDGQSWNEKGTVNLFR